MKGKLTDKSSNLPVKGVRVEILSKYAITDDTGGYVLERVPAGIQTLVSWKACYTTQQSNVTVLPCVTTYRNVGLPYSGAVEQCTVAKDFVTSWSATGGWPCQSDTTELLEAVAVNLQIHFASIRLWHVASTCARVIQIINVDTHQVIWSQTNAATDIWTPWLNTNHVYIVCFQLSAIGQGCDVDKYRYYQ